MLPPRSQLDRLSASDAFVWATGIEDTVITAPWPSTGRTLDEYALTGHTRAWREDLGLMAGLGVRAARYGVPWHRVQPTPGRWEWQHADEPLERLLALGIDPIVDLIHYGLPPWIDGAWLSPELPERAAEWAGRLAERFRGRIRWWTPLNEPRITAWYCGKLGWWPPGRRGWRGFAEVMVGVCRTIGAMSRALRATDAENVLCHVDATDLYESADPRLAAEVARRQEIVFLALDLVSGRVGPGHALRGWLDGLGVGAQVDTLQERPTALDVVGINLYPLFSRKILRRSTHGLRVRMPYADGAIVERLAEMYARRYGRPVMITETASVGSVLRRERWLADSVAATRRARERGVPLVGYTWWPMFALITWAYRQGTLPPERYLAQFGLWDLAGASLERVETPLVGAFRALVESGAGAVGELAPSEEAQHVP